MFADGPVDDRIVPVVGAVGQMATALAAWGGAQAGRNPSDNDVARGDGAERVFLVSDVDLPGRIRDTAPTGVDRIVDVAFASYIDLYADIVALGGVIASYFSPLAPPADPVLALLFLNTTTWLLGGDDLPSEAKLQASQTITTCLTPRATAHPRRPLPLDQIATAHQVVERRTISGRVLLAPDR